MVIWSSLAKTLGDTAARLRLRRKIQHPVEACGRPLGRALFSASVAEVRVSIDGFYAVLYVQSISAALALASWGL